VGLLFGVGSIGMIVGGRAAPALRRRHGFGLCWIGGLILMGVNSMSLRQQIIPDHLLGRVTAAFWTLIGVSGTLGAAGSTWLAARIGAPTVL